MASVDCVGGEEEKSVGGSEEEGGSVGIRVGGAPGLVGVEVRCDGCRYFYAPSFRCRRYAPKVRSDDTCGWPHVLPSYWCGEYQPREIEK